MTRQLMLSDMFILIVLAKTRKLFRYKEFLNNFHIFDNARHRFLLKNRSVYAFNDYFSLTTIPLTTTIGDHAIYAIYITSIYSDGVINRARTQWASGDHVTDAMCTGINICRRQCPCYNCWNRLAERSLLCNIQQLHRKQST